MHLKNAFVLVVLFGGAGRVVATAVATAVAAAVAMAVFNYGRIQTPNQPPACGC